VGETIEDTLYLKTKTPLFDRFLGRYITHTHTHTHTLTHAYNTQWVYVKRKNILLFELYKGERHEAGFYKNQTARNNIFIRYALLLSGQTRNEPLHPLLLSILGALIFFSFAILLSKTIARVSNIISLNGLYTLARTPHRRLLYFYRIQYVQIIISNRIGISCV